MPEPLDETCAAFVAIWVKLTPEKRVEAVKILQRIAARRLQSQKAG